MTSPVTKAMIESYALMVMVMGTFFVYFCGMVWAFCNPKLSGAEEECEAGKQAAGHGDHCWVCAPHPPPERDFSLLSDCTAVCREDHGIYNQIVDIDNR
ncbi:hypothetical protein PAMA_001613 [Pampus argenteus]